MFFTGGRDKRFLELLRLAADNLQQSADLLAETAARMDEIAARAEQAKELESKGDSYTHELVELINKTFVTPLDREELFALAVQIDDIVDEIEAAVSRLAIYRLQGEVDDVVVGFARILVESAREIRTAIGLLERRELLKMRDHCVRLNLLENEGDQLLRKGLEALFLQQPNPLRVIQWKEIYETLEEATDRCEDVANTLESVAMKHA